jgi:hypothetical protein
VASGTAAAVRAAFKGKTNEEAIAIVRRWLRLIGESHDVIEGLHRQVAEIGAEELSVPLNQARNELREAFIVVFLAWRRLQP